MDSLQHPGGVGGVRIRCADADVLRVCLLWYCTSMLTPADFTFMDTSPWDDSKAEGKKDPRIFQVFVWSSGKDKDPQPEDDEGLSDFEGIDEEGDANEVVFV